MRRLVQAASRRIERGKSREGDTVRPPSGSSGTAADVVLNVAPLGQQIGNVELGGEAPSRALEAVAVATAETSRARAEQRAADAEAKLAVADQRAAAAEQRAAEAAAEAEAKLAAAEQRAAATEQTIRAEAEQLRAEVVQLRLQAQVATSPAHGAPPPAATAGARRSTDAGTTEVGAWTLIAWLRSLDLAGATAAAFAPLAAQHDEFAYVQNLSDAEADAKLSAAGLQGLVPVVLAALARLREQRVATGSELNSKFADDGTAKSTMTYGAMDVFEAGIEGFIGPPLVREESEVLQAISTAVRGQAPAGPTLLGQMELEHCFSPDSEVAFPSQVGKEIVKPRAQWAFVTKEPAAGYHLDTVCAKTGSKPIYGVRYVLDSKGTSLCKSAYEKLVQKLEAHELRPVQLMSDVGLTTDELSQFRRIEPSAATDPDDDGTFGIGGRCRLALAHYWQLAQETSTQLVAQRGAPLILEEVLAIILCTRARRSNRALAPTHLCRPPLVLRVPQIRDPCTSSTTTFCAQLRRAFIHWVAQRSEGTCIESRSLCSRFFSGDAFLMVTVASALDP